MNTQIDKLFSAKEISVLWNIHIDTVLTALKSGKLRAFPDGRTLKSKSIHINRWIDTQMSDKTMPSSPVRKKIKKDDQFSNFFTILSNN